MSYINAVTFLITWRYNEFNSSPTKQSSQTDLRSRLSSSSAAISDLNWLDLSNRRKIQRCFFMYDLTSDNDRNNTDS